MRSAQSGKWTIFSRQEKEVLVMSQKLLLVLLLLILYGCSSRSLESVASLVFLTRHTETLRCLG